MDLQFNASKIRKIESENEGASFLTLIQAFSLENIITFVAAGCDCSREEAEKKIDKYLADGNDIFQLQSLIVKRLEDSGFLPKGMKLSAKIEKVLKDLKK